MFFLLKKFIEKIEKMPRPKVNLITNPNHVGFLGSSQFEFIIIVSNLNAFNEIERKKKNRFAYGNTQH